MAMMMLEETTYLYFLSSKPKAHASLHEPLGTLLHKLLDLLTSSCHGSTHLLGSCFLAPAPLLLTPLPLLHGSCSLAPAPWLMLPCSCSMAPAALLMLPCSSSPTYALFMCCLCCCIACHVGRPCTNTTRHTTRHTTQHTTRHTI
jgi:hypothetical protein